MEQWKDVLNYEGLYQVSDLGRVKSLGGVTNMPNGGIRINKSKILTPMKCGVGYLTIALYKNRKKEYGKVHRLVWEAFNGKTYLPIDHIIEGNKLDNRLCNLQAITSRENSSKHRLTKTKTSKYTGVSWRNDTNKWTSRITINGKYKNLGSFINEIDAANAYKNALSLIP